MARAYRQEKRAQELDERRAATIEAVFALWAERGFEGVTLQSVADQAGVSLKSVVRYFGTKEGLLRACLDASVAREEGARDVTPGDVRAVVATLAERYEQLADRIVRDAEIEFRYPVMAEWVARARASHRDWLGRAFAPWLPASGRVRKERLGALFWATEIRSWWALRHALGHDRASAERVMKSLLDALVASWAPERAGRSR